VTTALSIYGVALRAALAGNHAPVRLVDVTGRRLRSEHVEAWCATSRLGDAGLIDRCVGPTLDVGCGPGRIAAALTQRGRVALGIDVSAEAIRQARRRGVAALHRCVFSPLPGEGRWGHVLLADGNVGIGGDPKRLLQRCAALAGTSGDVIVEVDGPGELSWSAQVALSDGHRTSRPFAWASVGIDDLDTYAAAAAMSVLETWTEADRWFARLTTT
jgi:SAM-dependent methyltransferase